MGFWNRSNVTPDILVVESIPLDRVTFPAANDLELVEAFFGTGTHVIRSSACASGGTVTESMKFTLNLPLEYAPDSGITIRLRSKVDAVLNASYTIDCEVRRSNRDGTSGSDLVTTAAQSLSVGSYADADFVVTTAGLSVGDELIVTVQIALDDTAGASSGTVRGYIGSIRAIFAELRG